MEQSTVSKRSRSPGGYRVRADAPILSFIEPSIFNALRTIKAATWSIDAHGRRWSGTIGRHRGKSFALNPNNLRFRNNAQEIKTAIDQHEIDAILIEELSVQAEEPQPPTLDSRSGGLRSAE